jgi:hypothetical protein
MSKRVLLKLAVVMVALGAMMLLQGCGEDDDLAYSFVWAPTGAGTAPAVFTLSSW